MKDSEGRLKTLFQRLEWTGLSPWIWSTIPIAVLLQANMGEIRKEDLIVPLGVSFTWCLASVLAMARLLRDWRGGTTLASIFVAWFGLAGHVSEEMCWALFVALSLAVLWLRERSIQDLPIVRASIHHGGVAILASLAIGASLQWSARSTPYALSLPEVQPRSNAPHVVVLITDGHGRDDILEEMYPVVQPGLGALLRERGFSVARAATANYARTPLALGSMFNLGYLQHLVPDAAPDSPGMAPAIQLLESPEVFRLFRDAGYEIVAFRSVYVAVPLFVSADLGPGTQAANETWALFRNGSAIRQGMRLLDRVSLLFGSTPEEVRLRWEPLFPYLEFLIREVPTYVEVDHPRFIVAHLHAPHAPFSVYADGRRRVDDMVGFSGEGPGWHQDDPARVALYREGYAGQVAWLDRQIVDMVERIRRNSRRPVIVVVTGDHGPASSVEGSPAWIRERFGIFHAVWWPEGAPPEWKDDITPIHTMRLVTEEALGVDLPPFEDRAYRPGPLGLMDYVEVDRAGEVGVRGDK